MKRIIFGVTILALVAGAFSYQNCTGTRTRTADFNASLSDVESKLSVYEAQLKSLSPPPPASTLASFNSLKTLHASPTSTLYYGEAPSKLGTIAQTFPNGFAAFNEDTSGSTSSGAGTRTGAGTGTGTGASPSPKPAAVPTAAEFFVVVDHDSAGWHAAVLIVGSKTATSVSAIQSYDFSYSGFNTSESPKIIPGEISEGALNIPLVIGENAQWLLTTYDLNSDQSDLADGPVQFRLDKSFSEDESEEVGIFNMVVPD